MAEDKIVPHMTPAEALYPDEDIDIYDASGGDRKTLTSVAGAQFPKEVKLLGLTQNAGIMWNVELSSPVKITGWVSASDVDLPKETGEAKIVCDTTEHAVTGTFGRGVSGRSSCVEN